jgi:hypothetical protein
VRCCGAAVHSGPPVAFVLIGLLASPLLYLLGTVGAWRGARVLGDAPSPARSWIVCGLYALVMDVLSLVLPFSRAECLRAGVPHSRR